MTFLKVWLKYYEFLSVHYASYFKNVIYKVHSKSFVPMISSEMDNRDSFCNRKNSDRITSYPFLYLNARALFKKMDLLKNYVNELKPRVISITETWAKPEIPDGMYTLPGFNIFRTDRCNKKGGGVMIYIDERITSTQISLGNFPDFEVTCCKVVLSTNVFLGILCIYRPPNTTSPGDLQLIEVIDSFMALNFTYNVILGDFNMPDVKFKSHTAPNKFAPFVKCVEKYYLTQHIKEATRPNSGSILDLIFTTIGTNVVNVITEECLGSSDHSMINFLLEVPVCFDEASSPPKRNYYKADWISFSRILSDIDWNSVFSGNNIDKVWSNFKAQILTAVQATIPFKKRKPWSIKSNPKIRTALRYARRCHSVYRSTQTNEALLKYVQAKTKLQFLIRDQNTFYETQVVQTLREKPKHFWSFVKSKLKCKGNRIEMLTNGDEIIDEPAKMTELLADHFYKSFNHNVITYDFSSAAYNFNSSSASKILSHMSINISAVSKQIKYLPKSCSEDLNGLSYAIVKGGGDILALQICRLFNLSLSTESIPSDWKISVIHPIKKKSHPKSVNDYRPISITSCICRIFERLIRNRIKRFLEDNLSLNPSQHGFCEGRSTLTAHLIYSKDLVNALDQGLCIDCAYFDFSKAFDSVRHDYLIYKLSMIGISGAILRWIINYIKGRTQIVNVNGVLSRERHVSSGVIQGSVLGPLLFSIFVNDIDEYIDNCLLLKYADDIRMYRCFRPDMSSQLDNAKLFQNDMNALVAWSRKWDLKFNIDKCSILHFGRTNIQTTYYIADVSVVSRSQEKDLGVLFSNKFDFSEHIDSIVKKANQKLGIIARVFRNKNPANIIPLYVSFVRPYLEYNSIIWSPITKKHDHKIEKIQEKMLKLFPKMNAEKITYQQKLKQAMLLSLRARRIRQQLMIMFKMKKGLIGLQFEDFFQTNRYTRTRGNLFKVNIPKSRSKYQKNFFTNTCVKHWNKLKSSEINVQSSLSFKKSIKKYFDRENIW